MHDRDGNSTISAPKRIRDLGIVLGDGLNLGKAFGKKIGEQVGCGFTPAGPLRPIPLLGTTLASGNHDKMEY